MIKMIISRSVLDDPQEAHQREVGAVVVVAGIEMAQGKRCFQARRISQKLNVLLVSQAQFFIGISMINFIDISYDQFLQYR